MGTVAAPNVAVPAARERAIYSRVQVLGLVFMAVTPLLFFLAEAANGDTSGFTLFVIPGIAVLVVAALVRRFGTPAAVFGIAVAIGGAVPIFWAAFGLFAPASFFDFVPGLLFVLGFLMAVGGGITAVVRRSHREAHRTPGETRVMAAAVGLVLLGMLVSGPLTLASRTRVDAAAASGAVPVSMQHFEFGGELTVPADSPTQLLVHNADPFVHDLAIRSIGLEPVVIGPGSQQLVEITAPAGEHQILCTLHPGMEATLVAE